MKKKLVIFIVITVAGFTITAFVLLFTGPRVMNNQPSFRNFEAEYNLPPDDAVPFMKRDTNSKVSIPEANELNLSAGKVYYHYYCVFCHGENGKGDGPVGESYVPKPADLTNARLKKYNAEQLYHASFTGTGHSPALERVVPSEFRKFILVYIQNSLHE